MYKKNALLLVIILCLTTYSFYKFIMKPKVAVSIAGGIGNQLFAYAFARSYSLKNNANVTLINEVGQEHTGYKLNVFNTYNFKIQNYQPKFYEKIKENFNIKQKYDYSLMNKRNKIFFYGYLQSEKYFEDYKDIIQNDLTLKIRPSAQFNDMLRLIKSKQISASVHIRRGDFLNPENKAKFANYSNDYYVTALAILKSKIGLTPYIFVFSDDIIWAKNNIKIDVPVTYVDYSTEKNAYEDLILMSHCTHNIIANSSFSWWGAWLNRNPNKKVIAPKVWYLEPHTKKLNPSPDSWITIDAKYI